MRPVEGKLDMARLGIFQEMSYISIGDKYTSASNCPFNESAHRGRQMQAGTARKQCALQNGFFQKSFKRIFESEALTEPLRVAQQTRILQAKRNLGKAFIPCNSVKKLYGSGSCYGTLSGPLEALSPLTAVPKPRQSPGRNIMTSPPKRGSGYSYPNLTLSNMDLYASEPYDRAKEIKKKEAAIHRSKFRGGPFKINLHPRDFFQANPYHSDKPVTAPPKPRPQTQRVVVPFKPSSPSKLPGGMKSGTFDAYPSHSADPFTISRSKPKNQGPVFYPPPGPKSTPVKSIITVNVNRSVHSANYTSNVPAVITF